MSLILLTLAVLSGLVVSIARHWVPRNGDDVPKALEFVAVFGALGMPVILLLAVLITLEPYVPRSGTQGLATGAAFGAAIAGLRVAGAMSLHLLRWGLRQTSELRVSPPHLSRGIAELLGLTLLGMFLVTGLVALDARYGALALFAVPLFLAAYPLLDLVIMPWVKRLTRVSRPIGPDDRFGDLLRDWAGEAAGVAGLRGVRLDVVETGSVNAWAIHMPLIRPTILLSRPLLEEFSQDAIRAIVAHEIAHISHNHVPRLTLMSILGATLFGLVSPSLFELGVPGGLATGAVLAGLAGLPLLGLGPGWFSKRFEYEADARAASIVGTEIMQKALLELAEQTGMGNQGSLTHPPISSRVRRLGVAGS
jgi:Zn-dependent protease with chaperone function